MELIPVVQTRLGKANADFSQDEIAEISDLLTKASQFLEHDDAQGLGILTGRLHPRSGWGERFSVENDLAPPMNEVWRLAWEIERWGVRKDQSLDRPTPNG